MASDISLVHHLRQDLCYATLFNINFRTLVISTSHVCTARSATCDMAAGDQVRVFADLDMTQLKGANINLFTSSRHPLKTQN